MKIFLHLEGGLGNQLFQYAIGRTLALKTGGELILDPWESRRDRSRPVVLDKFNIKARFATSSENVLCRLVDSSRLRPLCVAVRAVAPRKLPRVVRRRWHGFDPAIFDIQTSVFLEGWFQSELYFRERASEIRQDLQLRALPSEENRKCLEQIRATQSVCIHIRRGDYVTNPQINLRIGLCEPNYYGAAIDHIRRHVQSPSFFVFSDDPEWTREHLPVPEPRNFVSHNCGVADWEDLRLMSACRHFIVANSTFSWWGAWLGVSPEKIVIAPKQWFADTSVSAKDIVPASWVRV